jgi:glycosyltransferase involved in cell wall biosynthesis
LVKKSKAAATPSKAARQYVRKPRNVCVVSEIEFGSNVTTEPSSTTYALAQKLAGIGENVTLLWVPSPTGQQPDKGQIAKLAEWSFEKFLVRLELLPRFPELLQGYDANDQNSVATYQYLKQRKFDVVYFSLEGGLAHFPTVAKRTGVFPNPPSIVVLAHEPLLWKLGANRQAIDRKEQMTVSHMEKTAAETCDHLVATSQTLIDWMKGAGWRLPESCHVAVPLAPQEWDPIFANDDYRPRPRPAREVVHFAGTEISAGLALFCDALDELADSGFHDLTVSVIGAFGHLLGEHSGGMVVRRARQWPFRLKLVPIRDEPEIFKYIRKSHALVAVTRSAAHLPLDVVACLDQAIPFISTDVGGISQIIQPKNAAAVLMKPTASAIAQKIASAFNGPFEPARPVQSRAMIRQGWVRLHNLFSKPTKTPAATRRAKLPLVTIVTAHYNRPHYLPQAIASVRRQTYSNIELIVVDDGSTDPEAIALLKELEPDFKRRGWRIIRQKNGFLGKARNTGIRAARGSLILFLDDDNALFPNAVSAFVTAITKSGADICTTFAKWLNEPFVPPDTTTGYMLYFPVGGPPDIAMINNPYGDANALFRRDVFDRIGYMNEERGFSASDWELFLRADLAGLEIITVPEPLYWYRSDAGGMNRNAEWLRNRRPIMDVFRKHNYRNLELFMQLGINSNTATHEKDINLWNLELRTRDDRYMRLSNGNANAPESLELLAEIAAREGRADTAISLLVQGGRSDFTASAVRVLDAANSDATPLLETALYRERYLTSEAMRTAHVGSFPTPDPDQLSYVEQSPDQLFLEARAGNVALAVLKGACQPGTNGADCWVYLPEELTEPAQFQIAVTKGEAQPFGELAKVLERGAHRSGWADVSRSQEPRQITVDLGEPTSEPCDILLAVRCGNGNADGRVLGGFSGIRVRQLVEIGSRHPRLNAPPQRQRTRRLNQDEMKRAALLEKYPSELPLLLVAADNGGIFLRPSTQGPVVGVLHSAFPAFARRVVATVEIAHEEASPFEFALALARPEDKVDWRGNAPVGAMAFSGWTKVSNPFELRDLSVSVREVDRKWLSIHFAIRLPRGSKPAPANAFWRKMVLVWD